MEPPSKRPRFGPGPFDNTFDDPDADELNERPEVVNARRDPAVQLERSRAFAAFKLKSTFESIFEKYEKDFTGVGDEIDLRTGEIVVNNGHIHSLKESQFGGMDEGDADSGDAASESGSLNEEERIVRGREDNRLSRLGQDALPLVPIPPQMGASPFLGGGWLGQAPLMGGPPGFPSILYPGQMPFGGFPMQYPAPFPMPTTDPTWRTPELPSLFVRNALTLGEPTPPVKKKVARLSLSAAREQDGGDEDDIFLGGFPSGKEKMEAGGIAVKQKVLRARPLPEPVSAKKKGKPPGSKQTQNSANVDKPRKHEGLPGRGPKQSQNDAKSDKPRKRERFPGQKKVSGSKPTAGKVTTSGGTLAQVRKSESVSALASTNQNEPTPTSPPVLDNPTESDTQNDTPIDSELRTDGSRPSTSQDADPVLDPGDPDVYINLSGEVEKLSKKPQNQALRVEIFGDKPPDIGSFKVIPPEPSEAALTQLHPIPSGATTAAGILLTTQPVLGEHTAPGSGNQARAVSAEAFSKNVVDPAYAFSDEDEPMSPGKEVHRKSNKTLKATNPGTDEFRQNSTNVGLRLASRGRESTTEAPLHNADYSGTERVGSPTLSLHLEDVMDHDGGVLIASFGGRDPPLPAPLAGTPKQTDHGSTSTSDQKANLWMTRRKSVLEAGQSKTIQLNSGISTADAKSNIDTEAAESVPAERRGSMRARKAQLRDATTTPHRPNVGGVGFLGHSTAQEIPETSPSVPPAATPLATSRRPALAPEVLSADPPFPSEEPTVDISTHSDRAPSPTLTDPSSRPQPTSPLPRTPLKTPTHRRPKAHPPTTATTTAAKQRKGILSLLPYNTTNGNTNDNNYDDQDELSLLTPIRSASAAPGTAVRSTPASHHVRLGLLVPASSSSSAAASKLKRSLGKPSSSSRGGTPTGSVGRKKRGGAVLPATPSSSARRLAEAEGLLVRTPGGTMRRCGEGAFRCEREFCFSCL